MSEYDRLAEAARIIGRAMARVPGLESLEREIVVSGAAAARYAAEGDDQRATAMGETIDVGLKAFADAVSEDPAVTELGTRDDVLSWTVAYFRAKSPDLAAHIPPRPVTFRRLPGRLDG